MTIFKQMQLVDEVEMPDLFGDGFSNQRGFQPNYQVDLYRCLSHDLTSGTSYDYYTQMPHFDEEIYYLMENFTLKNCEFELLKAECQRIIDERNRLILENFEKVREIIYETEIQYDYIDYETNGLKDTNLYKQSVCDEEYE